MRKKYLVYLIIGIIAQVIASQVFTTRVFATPVLPGECFDAARKFGATYKDLMPGDCIEKTINFASGNQKQVSESGNLLSFGFANILIARQVNPLKDSIIAGSNTQLENIIATAIDEKNKEIYALDSKKNAIYVFDSQLAGNVASKRYLKTDELKGAVSIAVDADRNALIVVFQKSVSVYGRNAYSEGRKPEHSTRKFSSLYEETLKAKNIVSATYNSNTGKLSLKDQGHNRLISVIIDSGGMARLAY